MVRDVMTSPVVVDAHDEPERSSEQPASGRGALLVGLGILASRLFGLVRERVFAHYFGAGMEAAAFRAALRIPNFLQNLFGEGVLSASFIPVYVGFVARKDKVAAFRLAGAVLGFLSLVVSLLVLAGMLLTPQLIGLIAPGLTGEARELAIRLVRILFPGTGLLVVSAWCLGILNSHRKFLLSYMAPVLWNMAIISALVLYGGRVSASELAVKVAWGAVAGSFLQTAVQWPSVVSLLHRFRMSLDTKLASAREVFRNFVPVVFGRGVVQISAYLDTAFASIVSERALAGLSYAQTLYLIPVSLFGMAVSASELPEMSRAIGSESEVAAQLRSRLDSGARRIAFFIVPSTVAFLLLGDVISGALFQSGRFGLSETRYLWALLAASSIGLLAATQGRLVASAFYALKDTRTPLLFAVVRVAATGLAAWFCATRLRPLVGGPVEVGALGIAVTSGLAGWLEFGLLKRALARRIGDVGLAWSRLLRLWGASLFAGAVGLGGKVALVKLCGAAPLESDEWFGGLLPMPALSPVVTAVAVLGATGIAYLLATRFLGIEQASALVDRLARKLDRRRQPSP